MFICKMTLLICVVLLSICNSEALDIVSELRTMRETIHNMDNDIKILKEENKIMKEIFRTEITQLKENCGPEYGPLMTQNDHIPKERRLLINRTYA